MTKDAIITLPHPHLRQKSQRIHVITPEIVQLISNMTAATIDWEKSRPYEIGAALAAVQVDHLERVIIVRSDLDDKENQSFTALINPEVIKYEGDITYEHEGCLSVKNIYGLVPRYSSVRIKAIDSEGNEVRLKAKGFLARVLQHEIDHTNGILFIDHIRDAKDSFFTLDDKGELEKLNYEKDIKTNSILWN